MLCPGIIELLSSLYLSDGLIGGAWTSIIDSSGYADDDDAGAAEHHQTSTTDAIMIYPFGGPLNCIKIIPLLNDQSGVIFSLPPAKPSQL